jgi:hypothetical protein
MQDNQITVEMFTAFKLFKESDLYKTLCGHVGEDNVGTLWVAFYHGYLEGANRAVS